MREKMYVDLQKKLHRRLVYFWGVSKQLVIVGHP
jgi:hypothetical protein